jgi:protein-S-isoprenylcysteine O-methyltransferase Ste14
MYTALMLFMLSYVIAEVTALSVQLWCGLLLVLIVKSLYEESLLTQRFPSYAQYKQRTWRFVPYVI